MNIPATRKACEKDIPSVLKIEKETINSWTANQFADEINNNNSFFYVLERDETIIGYIVVWKVYDEIHLNSIAITEKERGNSLGNLLIDSVINEIKPDCITRIILEVRSRNKSAISFYDKLGFRNIGTRKKYYDDDDAIIMEKLLNEKQ